MRWGGEGVMYSASNALMASTSSRWRNVVRPVVGDVLASLGYWLGLQQHTQHTQHTQRVADRQHVASAS